jgi:hypothetical protein
MVRTEELAQVLEAWIKKHDALHPRMSEIGRVVQARKNGQELPVESFSARAYLRHYSGRSEKSVWTILNRRTEYTSLTIADALLSAIESSALLDGTLWVGRDPREAANLQKRRQGGQWMPKGGQLTEAG